MILISEKIKISNICNSVIVFPSVYEEIVTINNFKGVTTEKTHSKNKESDIHCQIASAQSARAATIYDATTTTTTI